MTCSIISGDFVQLFRRLLLLLDSKLDLFDVGIAGFVLRFLWGVSAASCQGYSG